MIALRKRLQKYKRGQALVELTLILPMLLTLTLGAVELSNMIYTYQVMHHLTAQGANIASRLTHPVTPDDITKIIDGACPVIRRSDTPVLNCSPSNEPNWTVIYTRMGPDTSVPVPEPPYVVLEQQVMGSLIPGPKEAPKRICDGCGLGPTYTCNPPGCFTPNVPSIAAIGSSQTLHAFEVFYNYSPITVLGNFVGTTFAGTLYERSIF